MKFLNWAAPTWWWRDALGWLNYSNKLLQGTILTTVNPQVFVALNFHDLAITKFCGDLKCPLTRTNFWGSVHWIIVWSSRHNPLRYKHTVNHLHQVLEWESFCGILNRIPVLGEIQIWRWEKTLNFLDWRICWIEVPFLCNIALSLKISNGHFQLIELLNLTYILDCIVKILGRQKLWRSQYLWTCADILWKVLLKGFL
jgi:hypothetical protein